MCFFRERTEESRVSVGHVNQIEERNSDEINLSVPPKLDPPFIIQDGYLMTDPMLWRDVWRELYFLVSRETCYLYEKDRSCVLVNGEISSFRDLSWKADLIADWGKKG